MRSFQEFRESNNVVPHRYHLGQIQDILDKQERDIRRLSEEKYSYIKILAKIKTDLERALKDKSKLNDAVYNAINLARNVTPYTNDYGKTHQIDAPLKDDEKTL